MKALFIPLKAEFYDAFVSGEKDEEYRRAGGRWNARTCAIGRRVVLSKGYGKKHRTPGVIKAYREEVRDDKAWISCYAEPGIAACIGIQIGASEKEGEK